VVTKRLTGKGCWIERWEVQGNTGTYVVARKVDGSYGCSCPRWKFHKAPKQDCKHILAMLLLTVPVAAEVMLLGYPVGRKFRDEDGQAIMDGTLTPAGRPVVPEVIMQAVVEGETFKVSRKFRFD
jgi:hypothetical protein